MNVIADAGVSGMKALGTTDTIAGLHGPRPLSNDIKQANLDPDPSASAPNHEPDVSRIVSVRNGLSHNVPIDRRKHLFTGCSGEVDSVMNPVAAARTEVSRSPTVRSPDAA